MRPCSFKNCPYLNSEKGERYAYSTANISSIKAFYTSCKKEKFHTRSTISYYNQKTHLSVTEGENKQVDYEMSWSRRKRNCERNFKIVLTKADISAQSCVMSKIMQNLRSYN